MNLEAVLQRFRGVRRNGSGWMAQCPAHADKNPSMSVSERNGRILIHCFAGCTTEAVCEALGIKVSQLFTEPGTRSKPLPPRVRSAQRQITGLRNRLTRCDRELPVTVVHASRENPDPAIARALALAVEGELCQIVFEGEA